MSTYPSETPRIVERVEQPYAAIRCSVTMDTIAEVADRLPDVFVWLGARGIEPVDAPFFKYNVIDMERELEIEVGVPIASPIQGDETVLAGVLPSGRYASVSHTGHPDELLQVTTDLLAWADEQGLQWDSHTADDGDHWACRLELYRTDPAVEPDMSKWETDLAFKLKG